ncbi:MAG: single-stranded DNA-binding protein [Holosporales bacterium]|jgi:single-strand DNA-binding protein|nr:single-stranded DNA-binding protein [Holosporales bacterium]
MAGSLNKVMLMGNLGKDPEIKFMPDGSKIVLFSMATTEFWKDKTTGERRDRTEWHRIVIFNDRLADIIEKYVRKGSRVYIEGQLQTRKWTDQSGVEKYTTEIVLPKFRGELLLMDSKRSDLEDSGTPFSADIEEAPIDASSPDALLNDDIPF